MAEAGRTAVRAGKPTAMPGGSAGRAGLMSSAMPLLTSGSTLEDSWLQCRAGPCDHRSRRGIFDADAGRGGKVAMLPCPTPTAG